MVCSVSEVGERTGESVLLSPAPMKLNSDSIILFDWPELIPEWVDCDMWLFCPLTMDEYDVPFPIPTPKERVLLAPAPMNE